MTMAVMMVMSTHAQAADFMANDIAITGLQRVTIESLVKRAAVSLGSSGERSTVG